MTPMIIYALVFLGVASLIGLLAFVFRDQSPQTATRLDLLVGKRRRGETLGPDILRKSAFDNDKKSLLETLTPKFLTPKKLFEQADCHSKPGTLTGVALLLAGIGATGTVLARLPLILIPINAAVLFTLPWIWLPSFLVQVAAPIGGAARPIQRRDSSI